MMIQLDFKKYFHLSLCLNFCCKNGDKDGNLCKESNRLLFSCQLPSNAEDEEFRDTLSQRKWRHINGRETDECAINRGPLMAQYQLASCNVGARFSVII